jgi:hypothetical protein
MKKDQNSKSGKSGAMEEEGIKKVKFNSILAKFNSK